MESDTKVSLLGEINYCSEFLGNNVKNGRGCQSVTHSHSCCRTLAGVLTVHELVCVRI